jgi:selenocysteine lyase/cysteine desulfurase
LGYKPVSGLPGFFQAFFLKSTRSSAIYSSDWRLNLKETGPETTVYRPPLPQVVGSDLYDTLYDGTRTRIIQLNNAATTPPFRRTVETVNRFLETYGALHRGAGPRARLTFELVEQAVGQIRRFVGCGPEHSLLFTQNTSAAINLLARLLSLDSEDVVLTSETEHTSNNLPWRFNSGGTVAEIRAFDNGALDYDQLESLIRKWDRRVKVIAVSGASNQTGYIPDLKRIGALAHSVGALFFVDAAQLAPHRPLDMQADGIDALALSAHKVYAPFGLGLLVLPTGVLERVPVDPGGGSIDMISDREIVWAPAAERHQTGTWNATGIVALGASCQTLQEAGWENILQHEKELVHYTAGNLPEVPGLKLYVPPPLYLKENRIGTFPFNLNGLHHSLVAAVLEHEYGIEVRSGTICNHRLVRRWHAISDEEQHAREEKIQAGDRLATYGIVRASLGVQNNVEDIEALIKALTAISVYGYRLEYRPDPAHETFEPVSRVP